MDTGICDVCGVRFERTGRCQKRCAGLCAEVGRSRTRRRYFEANRAASYRRTAWRREGIWQRVQAIKLEAGCVDCGYGRAPGDNPDGLTFDHVDGSKEMNVGAMLSYTWARIEAEIAKCEVRCGRCHLIVGAQRRRALRSA